MAKAAPMKSPKKNTAPANPSKTPKVTKKPVPKK